MHDEDGDGSGSKIETLLTDHTAVRRIKGWPCARHRQRWVEIQ
jgi:hypothetical protein